MVFHSVIKIGAFFSAGAVLHETKKEYISDLGGLGRKMPVTFTCYTIYALALTGIPPLCGFFSKWYIATAGINAGSAMSVAGVIGLLISAFLTAMYMINPAIKAFTGGKNKKTEIKEADAKMLIPMVLCAAACILLGVFVRVPVNIITEVLGI
jgi:multicomponent Na+:H+ antiporter subunit D